MALFHFENSLHVESILITTCFCTIHFNIIFPCVSYVRRKTSDHDITATGHSRRHRTYNNVFSKACAAFCVNNQASFNLREVMGGCVHQELCWNLVGRSIPAMLWPWSFRVLPRTTPGHLNSCISGQRLCCFLNLALCHIGCTNGIETWLLRDSRFSQQYWWRFQVILDVTCRLLNSYVSKKRTAYIFSIQQSIYQATGRNIPEDLKR
jgi:hypothetical protein